jgi:hypothetical protein
MSDEAEGDNGAPEPGTRAAHVAARSYYATLSDALSRHPWWPERTARWSRSDSAEVDHMLAALVAEFGEDNLRYYVAPTNAEVAIATNERAVGWVRPGFIAAKVQWDRPRVLVGENDDWWMELSCFNDKVDGDRDKVQVARCVFCADVLDEDGNCRSGCT